MITILHGDHIEKSRNELLLLKQNAGTKEIRELSGRNLSIETFIQATESHSLLGEQIFIIVENLFSPLGRKVKTAKIFIDQINTLDEGVDCLIWEPKELSKEMMALFPKNVKLQTFLYPKIIFAYLDNLKSGNGQNCLKVLIELLKTEPAELVWSMTVSRMRQLIQAQSHFVPERMQTWQITRLTNQSRSFTLDTLLKLYKKMLNMEYSLKSGNSPFTMTDILLQTALAL